MVEKAKLPERLYWTSRTCIHDRAAFVQMARDGKVREDGFRGEGMNGRCTDIWRA